MNRGPSNPRCQQGFSLLASLILLVVVTLVALAGMRSVAMESRMSDSMATERMPASAR